MGYQPKDKYAAPNYNAITCRVSTGEINESINVLAEIAKKTGMNLNELATAIARLLSPEHEDENNLVEIRAGKGNELIASLTVFDPDEEVWKRVRPETPKATVSQTENDFSKNEPKKQESMLESVLNNRFEFNN